jgi:hypothetical protein
LRLAALSTSSNEEAGRAVTAATTTASSSRGDYRRSLELDDTIVGSRARSVVNRAELGESTALRTQKRSKASLSGG